MKLKEAKAIMVDYCDVKDFMEVLEGVVYENFHNPAVCTRCKEVYEVEPDYGIGVCPGCHGKTVSATYLGGIF